MSYIVDMKTERVETRIEFQIKKALEKEAESQGRTLSNLIQWILSQYINNKEE